MSTFQVKGNNGSTVRVHTQPKKVFKVDGSLRGPKGPTGPTGDTGSQGPIGPIGLEGPQGTPGEGAYPNWLNEGNVGTEADFLATLVGDDGPQGPIGADGPQGPIGLKGDKGDKGDPAIVNGKSGATITLNPDDLNDATTVNKFTTSAEKTKLSGIATGATANATDASLRARSNHTGTQLASTISDLSKSSVGLGNVPNKDFTAEVNMNTAKNGITPTQASDITANNAKISYTDGTKVAGIEAGAQVNTVNSVSGKTGAVTLAKADVGLANVDDTSDANKPLSTAQSTAIELKADKTYVDTQDATKVSKSHLPFNVKDYGAIGDGIAFDQVAIQSAVDAASAAGGGLVYLPKGTYKIGATITWLTNVSMKGDGPGKTIIKMVGQLFDAISQFSQGAPGGGDPSVIPLKDVVFSDFEIDGSGLTYSSAAITGKGIFILYMQRSSFINLYIHHCIGTGLGADFLDQVVMDRVIANNNGRNWDGVTNAAGQSGIGIGTNWKSVEAVTVSNCHTLNNGNYGIFVETQTATVSQTVWPAGARIVGCYSEGNLNGFGNKGSGGTTFSSCEARNNLKYGFVSNQKNRDDLYSSCKAIGSGVYGFYIRDSLGNISLNNCIASNNTLHGIRVENTSSYATDNISISNSALNDNGRAGIALIGGTQGITNCSISDTLVRDNGKNLESSNRQSIIITGKLTNATMSGNFLGNSIGSTFQQHGIQVLAGSTVDGLSVIGNTFKNNFVSPILFSATITNLLKRSNDGIVDDKLYATGFDASTSIISNVLNPVSAQDAATKIYVDTVVGGGTPDATTSAKGKIQLAGDLAGTAALPTVPGLDLKAPIASPTFTGTITAPAIKISDTSQGLQGTGSTSLVRLSGGLVNDGAAILLGGSANGSLPNQGVLRVGLGNTAIWTSSAFSPGTSLAISFGSSTKYWADIYAQKLNLNSTASLDGSTAGVIKTTKIVDIDGVQHISGTGFPEGVVTAPVGSIYIDKNNTNGATQWSKATGTGNTGWVVSVGDTGWRNISSLVTGLTSGQIRIKRNGAFVTVLIQDAVFGTNTGTYPMYSHPTGFSPAGGRNFVILQNSGTIRLLITWTISQLYSLASGGVINGAITYETDALWPTTLPGTAA